MIDEPEVFDACVGEFLRAELEREQLARILDAVLAGRYAEHPLRFAAVIGDDGGPVAAALRTPPHNLSCTRLPDPEPVATALIDAWLERDPDVGGVAAVPDTARAIAAAWARRTGGETETHASMAMHAARAIEDPPRPTAGRLRIADPGALELLVGWWRAFYAEAEPLHHDDAEQAVAARLEDGGLYIWEDGGGAVSLIGARMSARGVGWIGPVYTPVELRRRGYAVPGSRPPAACCSRQARSCACCSPTSPTRPPTRFTTRSAIGGSPTGRTTASPRRADDVTRIAELVCLDIPRDRVAAWWSRASKALGVIEKGLDVLAGPRGDPTAARPGDIRPAQ